MKLPLIIFALLLSSLVKGQYVYHMKADSVRVYSDCDTAELVLKNHTKDTLAYLYNKGGGRTEFRRINLEPTNDGRLSITSGDTVSIFIPPALKPVYLMTEDVCQVWDGSNIVVKQVTGSLYLKIDNPANMVDGKELYVSNQSDFADYYTGGVTVYSYSAPIWYEGGAVNAFKVRWGAASGLHLVYAAADNMFYVVNAFGTIEVGNNGPCPQ